ncbi:MAG: DUF92 domain-containing protein [Bacteroidia bacterium]|nr:DUF92 domain-containing protein [Bacteroidia bacterium]
MDFPILDTELIRIASLSAAILLLLAAVELMRRRFRIPVEIIRKSVHILTGVLIAFAPPLFPRGEPVVFIASIFVLFNALAYARGWLTAVHHTQRRSYGTVYYPLSLLVLAALFWDEYPDLVIASIMVMAIGDAAAGIVGESMRRPHQYAVTSDKKSLEGSMAMFSGSFIALLLILSVYGDSGLDFSRRWNASPVLVISALFAISLFATALEAASSRGLDNLSVPFATAFALHLCFASGVSSDAMLFLTGTILGSGIAYLAWRLRMLSLSGAVATFILATIIFGIGGWKWTLPIFTFFILSSSLSRWRKNQKAAYESIFEKSGTRDAGQVIANGGLAALVCVAWYTSNDERLYVLYLIAVAVVTADTWGTEIGLLSRSHPRSILTFKEVPPGTSGGISIFGTLAGALGALVVTLTALPFISLTTEILAFVLLAALAGSAIDSILGATVQAQYQCRHCGTQTEKPIHCNDAATLLRGQAVVNNDAVNLLSTTATLLLAGIALLALGL